jgi:hypothetical protein
MKLSRSKSRSICSSGRPVCLAISELTLARRYMTSRAAISMSEAVPCVPPEGWCCMMRAWGREKRLPLAPPASRKQPMLAAKPMQIVDTGLLRCCMVS